MEATAALLSTGRDGGRPSLTPTCEAAESELELRDITPISPRVAHAWGYDCFLLFHFMLDPFYFLFLEELLQFPGLLTPFLVLSGIFEFFPSGWGGLIPLGTGLSELLLRTQQGRLNADLGSRSP